MAYDTVLGYDVLLTLTKEQRLDRRQQLLITGYLAFASSLILLLFIALHSRKTTYSSRISFYFWTKSPFGQQWGTYGILAVVALYSALQMWLTFRWTGIDFKHLTKAFGQVGSANFPALMVLGSKHGFFVSGGYERVNIWHRWLARIMFCLLAHGILYSYFFHVAHRWFRLLDIDIGSGAVALAAMVVIFVPALRWIRDRYYSVFYIIHIIASPLIFPLMFLHVSYARIYAVASIAVFILDKAILRKYHHVQVIMNAPLPNLLHIKLTRSSGWPKVAPGSHVIVSIPSISKWSKIPLTVARVQGDTLHLFSRVRDGFTYRLAGFAGTGIEREGIVEGPYGRIPEPPQDTLVISGGVGVTFALGMRRHHEDVFWINRKTEELCCISGPGKVFLTNDPTAEKGSEVDDWIVAGTQRPVLGDLIHKWISEKGIDRGETIGIAVCGPLELGDAVRDEVGRLVGQGRRVWFWREEFGW